MIKRPIETKRASRLDRPMTEHNSVTDQEEIDDIPYTILVKFSVQTREEMKTNCIN